ncbi:hypothetical protein KO507_01995 [Gilvimarinus agarilyticus]|uniref:hypothetical protein n=1 Tax=unclassified Gilvimarinus TaxID=2642066 RepID=UPI001C08FE96|nr:MULTISPECIES: hypothetical protein [unclassified Gilvimarinus]MBU2884533.1 hypothetical protein [Gilvimarinus agarilyticus]MDO6569661.1 hypothetical protein [Gilvimarinus sp. 2_MG-2023]MDO6748012.1 hypothetical protein [Gilvimarinus sp. 1_MG-2023]
MFRFLAKSALATFIWKRYHRPILATLTLLLGYFLVGMVHGDYVDYAHSAQDTTGLWLSYLLKWVLLITFTLIYYFYLKRILRTPEPAIQQTPPPTNGTKNTREPPSASDPFAGIRDKKTLKSHADRALDKAFRPKN